VMVVSIAMLMLTVGVPGSASAHATGTPAVTSWGSHTILVLPNGHNDTSDIQAAFNTCTSHDWICTIQLVKGTYYTDQITVYGFQGSFVGAGQRSTIIQGLPNLASPGAAYNTSTTTFWSGLPGPANPWPVLFTFVNGSFGVSRMTVTDTNYNPIPGGYDYYGTTFTYLWADITVTGAQAYATFDHVTVIGGAGEASIGPGPTPSSFNTNIGINFEGLFLPTPTSPLSAQIPLSGSFTVTNSVMQDIYSGYWIQDLLNARATVCYNSISGSPLPGFADLSNTPFWFCGNQVTNVGVGAGVYGLQSYLKTDLLPSEVYVTGNYFGMNWGGSGPFLADFGPGEGLTATLSAVVTGNTIVTNMSCGCYTPAYPVIFDYNLSSIVVLGNTVRGGGSGVIVTNLPGQVALIGWNTIIGALVGVEVGASVSLGNPYTAPAYGTNVTANVIKNSADYGIAVVGGSSYDVVSFNFVKGSGLDDLYWDQTGTNDFWFANVYATSSPATLP